VVRRGVHFAGFKGVRFIGLGVDVEIENALDLLLPENAALFEPCQYIRRNFKLFAGYAASLKAGAVVRSFMP
jgi:hypothetical protein